MADSPKIELQNVELRYHTRDAETSALSNINLAIGQKEFVGIVGPSGCGKTTLLSLIAGLLKPSSGKVLIDGQPVESTSPKVGYMLQHDYLFEWRTIFSNTVLGLEIQGCRNSEALEKTRHLLDKYGLRGFEKHYPRQLSGGMRQRAALIRTLAVDPEILLLDEPFSALDYQTRLTMENEIGNILREEQKTVVLVTHDISEAIAMCDRVVVMGRRPGTIKSEHIIRLTQERNTPMGAREAPEFNNYFNIIWEELDINV